MTGAAAIAWGSIFGLQPASAQDGSVTAQVDETTSSTTSTTDAPTTTTTAAVTTTTAAPVTTTSVPGTPGDPDGDGAANEPALDLLDTGITVDRDPTVALIDVSDVDGVLIALDIDEGAPQKIRNAKWNAARSIGNVALPSGYASFDVINAAGPIDVVTIWSDRDVKARTLFKGTSSSMKAFAVKDADFSDGVASFVHTIQDGGAGDIDGVVNGTIVDPVGPGYVTAAPATTATTVKKGTLVRTGTDMSVPAATGVIAIVAGAALLAIAWKPRGSHFLFDR